MYMHVKLKKARQMPKSPSKLDLNGTGYCASFNFRRTARAITKLYDTALQKAGIRSTQFAILVGIAKNQPVSIGALARSLPAWRKAQERFVAKIGPGHWVELRNELERLAGVAVDLEKPEKEAA